MPATPNDQHGAYTAHQRGDETIRETEARALLSCASRLERARNPGSTFEEYGDAIRHNQQLWTIFQVCLCEPDNQLPQDLKGLLLSLSRYVDKTSFRALGSHNPDMLASLININRNIAAGLSVKQSAAGSSTEAQAPALPEGGSQPVITSV